MAEPQTDVAHRHLVQRQRAVGRLGGSNLDVRGVGRERGDLALVQPARAAQRQAGRGPVGIIRPA